MNHVFGIMNNNIVCWIMSNIIGFIQYHETKDTIETRHIDEFMD